MKKREFPGGSVKLRLQALTARDPDSIPGQGIKISQATKCSQKKKRAKEMRNSGAKTSLIKVKNSLELFKRKFIQKEEIICQVEDRIMLNIESNKQTKRKD